MNETPEASNGPIDLRQLAFQGMGERMTARIDDRQVRNLFRMVYGRTALRPLPKLEGREVAASSVVEILKHHFGDPEAAEAELREFLAAPVPR